MPDHTDRAVRDRRGAVVQHPPTTMAIPKQRQGSDEPDLTNQSDFQLLNEFTALACSESSRLKAVALEIMCQYTSHLEVFAKPQGKDHTSTPGDARWGDAKRVEAIFGIKRNKLLRLVDEQHVVTSSLDNQEASYKPCAAVRAKRLFSLTSVAEHVETKVTNPS